MMGSNLKQAGEAFFIAQIGALKLGIDASSIRVIQPFVEPSPIPLAPPHVLGLVGAGADVIAVFDAARLWGPMPKTEDDSELDAEMKRVVVLHDRDLEAGLVCERLLGIAHPEALEPLSVYRDSCVQDHVTHEFDWRDERIPILDAGRVLDAARVGRGESDG